MRCARSRIAIGECWASQCGPDVLIVVDAYKHPGPAAGQPFAGDARILYRLPGYFKQEPLLGIYAGGLAWRDFEEACVEAVYVLQESAIATLGRARRGMLLIASLSVVSPAWTLRS